MTDIVLPRSASVPPDRASTRFFRGQLQLPQSFCDNMDATNENYEIPASFISDAFNSFAEYQESCMAQLKIFSFSFDLDRSTDGR